MKRIEVDALRAIADRSGGILRPEAVVEHARNPESPLHDHFTWDDAEAAEAHRLDQARSLIRRVRVEVISGDRVIEAPQFIRDPDTEARGQGYVNIANLRTREDAAREAVVREFARAASALARARMLAEVLGLQDEVDVLIGRVEDFRSGLSPE